MVAGFLVLIAIIAVAVVMAAGATRRTARNTRRVACPHCQHEILPSATTCPWCGQRVLWGWAARRERLWRA